MTESAPSETRPRRALVILSWVMLALSLVLLGMGLLRWLRAPEVQHTSPQLVAPQGSALLVRVSARERAARTDSARDAGSGEDAAATAPSVGGRAKDAAPTTPVDGATLVVFAEREDGRFAEVARARTDANGAAQLTGLPTGHAWVLSEAPGLSRVSARVVLGKDEQVELVLEPRQRLTVTLVDDEKQAIRDATVLVSDSDALPFGELTDAEGRAHFERLASGPYRVRAFARGYEAADRVSVVEDPTIVLRRLGTLAISVLDSKRAAAPGAEIFVVGSSLWPARRLQADEQGKAELGGLLAGVYDLRARRGAQVSTVVSAVGLERGQRRAVELVLGVGRSVQLLVESDAPDNRPIEGASVVVAEFGLSPFPLTGKTNAEGRAWLGPISAGPAFASVRAKDYVGRAAVPIPEDSSEPLLVVLRKGGTLRGRTVDVHGHAIAGARVEVIGIDLDGQPIAETPLLAAYRDAHFDFAMKPLPLVPAGELGVTLGHVPYVNEAPSSGGWTQLPADYSPWISDVEGRFRAHPVPPGRVRALVRHPAYVEGLSEVIELGPGGEAEVTVTLLEGGRLSGRVLDPRGFPVAGARVLVSAQSGSFEQSVLSSSDGSFRLAAVPAQISVALARPDDLTRFVWRGDFEVPEGRERDLELELPEARETAVFRVVDREGKPVELAQVSVSSLQTEVPLRLTRFSAENGVVSFEDLVGLEVRIAIQAPDFVPLSMQLAKAPAEREFSLSRGMRVTGKVTGVRGRTEVAGARISLSSDGGNQNTLSDARGRYAFSLVPLGRVKLSVAHDDFASAEREVLIEETGREDRAFELDDIDLPEQVIVHGVVVDSEGEPVQGARVGLGKLSSVLVRGALPSGSVLSDEAGAFSLRGIAPGSVELSAISASKGRGSIRLSLEAGDELRDLRIEVTPADEQPEITTDTGGVAISLGERDRAGGVAVVITAVSPHSEAERAGLRPGDVLLSIDGADVRDMRGARRNSNGKAGSDVVLEVRRGKQRQSYRVRREAISP